MPREMVSCLDHFSFLEIQEDAEDEIKRKKVIIKERSSVLPLPSHQGNLDYVPVVRNQVPGCHLTVALD
jgi:hypothetical protein